MGCYFMDSTNSQEELSVSTEGTVGPFKNVLSAGFRPFFLLAGAYAVLAMAAWLFWLALHANNGVVPSPTFSVAPHLWHGHEMLFGFAGAVITGFLLTAVPNWTGTPAMSGTPLILLMGTWLLGRFVMWFSTYLPPLLVAFVDVGHFALLAGFIGYALSFKPAARNLVFIAILFLLIVANATVHAEWIGWSEGTASWGLTLAIYLLSTMIVIIGGRVVPAFTRNAMKSSERKGQLPQSYAVLDAAAILSAVSLPLSHLLGASASVFAILATVAAVINAVRLVLWCGWRMLDQPIVWSLHLGYLFVVLGFGSVGLGETGLIGSTAAVHVLAAGAVGCMTLAIMTRASLGHTGRPLRVSKATAVSYLLIATSGLVRAFLPSASDVSYFTVMYLAGACWIAGFGLFCISYAPILVGPRRLPHGEE